MKIGAMEQLPMSNEYVSKQEPRVQIEEAEKQGTVQPVSEVAEQNIQNTEKAVIDAIEKANKITINHNTRAEFSVHERTKDIMIKIIDTENNEVIREFPPEKFLDLIAKLWDMAGILVDERR